MKTEKRLVEEWLPLSEINENAGREMGFIRIPKISNLHLWLARRPTSTARALTLASMLPCSVAFKEKLNELLGFNIINKQPYRLLYLVDPDREVIRGVVKRIFGKDPKDIVIVDPMAGGGSIPLESLRLGFKTIAIEYNPVAYIILKATLEYPAKYGEKLYEDVRKEARALIEYANVELSKYYAEDMHMRAIIARGFKCPNCGGLVPIVHGTRLRDNGPYMKFWFDESEKKFKVSIVDEEIKFQKLRCPYCDRPFTKDEVFNQWIRKHKELLKIALDGDIEEAKNHINTLLETHIPLLKQIRRGFAACDQEDIDKLVNAYVDLTRQMKEHKPYLPSSLIPKENRVFQPVKSLGIDYWYELFNPRQLLVFLKLIKYVSERTKELIKSNPEYGVAIATYLALGIDKLLDHHNIATMWNTHRGIMNRLGDQYAAKKSVSFGLEYCEAEPMDTIEWAFEPNVDKPTATHGGLCPVLKQLCNWLFGSGDRLKVYLGDACELSKILGKENVDLVNVDPPYFNQHFYSDFSEFFWQGLMLMLKPAIEAGFLFNRDKTRGRVECIVSGWSPLLPTVPRVGEIIVRSGTGKLNAVEVSFTKEWWRGRMWKFFTETFNVLKNDGILIVWYTHSDPEAWEAMLTSLYTSNFILSKVWNVRTEFEKRFIARLGGSAFFTSLALIARKSGESVIVGERIPKELLINERVKEAITESVADALKSARVSGASDREAYVMALAGAIAGATKIHNPALESTELAASETLNKYVGEAREEEIAKLLYKRASAFFRESLYPVALYLGASKVLEEELLKAGLSDDEMRFIIGGDDITRAYFVFWLSTRYHEEGVRAFIDYDFAEKICKVLDIRVGQMEDYGLLRKLEKNAYSVLFGQEVLDAIKNKLELLDRTVVGQAMYLLKLIVESPIRDDEERCVRDVFREKRVSKQVAATALFLLRTALKEELEKASISEYRKPFIEAVLKIICVR